MKVLSLPAVVLSVLCVLPVNAANWVPDARGGGMGNTGVTTADYLLAPFYNPALVAVYQEHDDFGLLLPSVNVNLRDPDDTLDLVDDVQDSYNSGDYSAVDNYLDQLANNEDLKVNAGVGMALALPANVVSVNLFSRGYAEILASADIDSNADPATRYQNSNVNVRALLYEEVGAAFAKQVQIMNQAFSFGISPKIQKLTTYYEEATVDDYDLNDYDQSKHSKTAFNMDVGAVWLYQNLRLGIAGKDLFSQSVKVQNTSGVQQDSYKMNAQVTLSAGYVSEFFTAALDVDATKQKRFSSSHDDTQFMRFGIEGDAWGWAQLRAGYEIDLENNVDNTLTVGLGISPANVVNLDLAFNYADENQLGAALNLAFTF